MRAGSTETGAMVVVVAEAEAEAAAAAAAAAAEVEAAVEVAAKAVAAVAKAEKKEAKAGPRPVHTGKHRPPRAISFTDRTAMATIAVAALAHLLPSSQERLENLTCPSATLWLMQPPLKVCAVCAVHCMRVC